MSEIQALFQSDTAKIFRMSKEQLLKLFKISEKQFDRFALRADVAKDKPYYTPDELNPSYFETLVRTAENRVFFLGAGRSRDKVLDKYTAILKEYLLRKDYPINTHVDHQVPEIRHDTWEASPKKFHTLIQDRLHKLFNDPQTQLHAGLPGLAVSTEKGLAIARGTETRIILRLAQHWEPGSRDLSYSDYTSLVEDPPNNLKHGVIRYAPNEFSKPIRSHNLEVRQWTSLDAGFDDIAFAAIMARNPGRIVELVPPDFKKTFNDPQTANLKGALQYAAAFLMRSSNPGDRASAEILQSFVTQMSAAGQISPDLRLEIAEFLNEDKTIARLGPETFLNP
jgi:hypothetical protein